jgi:hypothetical protein
MNKIEYIITAILLISLTSRVEACSCFGPDKFVNSISEFTAEVEVLSIDSLHMMRGNRSHKYPVTILLVQKVIKGKAKSDTLFLMKDSGFECFHSVPYREKGQRYILSGNFEDKQVISSSDTLTKPIFYLDLCLENILILRDNKVIGNVTKNRKTKVSKRQRSLARINKKLSYHYYNKRIRFDNKEKLMQKMSERKFYRILERKNIIDRKSDKV